MTQPRKMRRFFYNAPQHIRRKMIAAHLAEDLMLRYKRRAIPVVRGDTVKVMRGSYKGRVGKVRRVDVKKQRIEIEGEDNTQTLVFIVNINGEEIRYSADKVHELPERFVVLPEHWIGHIDNLKLWNDTLWTQNSCVIPAMEACEWWNAVEVYAFLAISVAVEKFNLDFEDIYRAVIDVVENQEIDDNINLPSEGFPNNEEEFKNCPVCKKSLSDTLSEFRDDEREETWQPAWSSSKRSEGEDGSNQILHILPLIETEIRHKVGQVKFGHRWCNVAMTDHSLEEALDFFEYIVRAHNRI